MRPNVFELLNKINELLLSSSVAELSKLEYDLLKQNIQQLYEQVLVEREAAVPVPVAEETPVVKAEPAAKTNPVQVTEPVKQQAPPAIIEVKTALIEEPVLQEEIKQKTGPKASINDITSTQQSLNEKLKTSPKEIHKVLSAKPLKNQIDLNKRHVLVKELFGGNADLLSKAIDTIDTHSSFASAETFIKDELAKTHQWDFNSQTVRMFIKLVKQKFSEE